MKNVIPFPDDETQRSLEAVLKKLRAMQLINTTHGEFWIAEVLRLCSQFCKHCGHDRRWHEQHHPRHPFKV